MLSVPNPRPAIESAMEYVNACKGIHQYPVRFRKNGKTRGRPSKGEIWASKITSAFFESDPWQNFMKEKMSEFIMYGTITTTDEEYEKVVKQYLEGK